MNNNLIISVGRQLGSGGRIVAKMLADEFGCKFYDREVLNLAAKESGFSEEFFEQNDERKGFLDQIFHMHVPLIVAREFVPSPKRGHTQGCRGIAVCVCGTLCRLCVARP